MKKLGQVFGVIALIAVIGFSMTTCSSDSGGGGWTPLSKLISWIAGSTQYKLSVTELEGNKNDKSYTYLLSVGNDGYSTGLATINGNSYSFSPRETGGSAFAMNIDSTAKKVTTTIAYTIKLVKPEASPTPTDHSMSKLENVDCEIKDTTGGIENNPFPGTWADSIGTVKVKSNLTWSYSQSGYSNSGSYAPIENTAVIYDSKKDFFGFAKVSGNTMETLTRDGGYIPFTKK